MRCPYRTKVVHYPERMGTYTKYPAEDVTDFCECLKDECPFYYSTTVTSQVCRKVESEVKEK